MTKLSHILLCSLPLAFLAMPATAQMRVDARIQMSSGSCSGCNLSNKTMNGVHLNNANMAGSSFNNSNLSGGRLDNSDLSDTHFRSALMYRVQGAGVKMPRAILEDATLTEANLPDSKFTEANFSRADLSRATFTNTDFNGARFDQTIMSETTLNGADFSGADLSTSQGLKQAQLDVACGDMRTRLPVGLSVPYCDGSTTATDAHTHHGMSAELDLAAQRIDRAIADVENLLAATNTNDRVLRTRLQRIHSDLVQSKAAFER